MNAFSARSANSVAWTVAVLAGLLSNPSGVEAHGTEREIQVLGLRLEGYDVTVRTAPKAPPTGRLHIEVLLIAPDTLSYIEQATITATARHLNKDGVKAGSVSSSYRKPWHEMELILKTSGHWEVQLSIDGPRGQTQTVFPLDVLPEQSSLSRP